MKLAAPIALALLLLSCSSSTSVIDQRVLGCESGQDVEILAGLGNATLEGITADNVEVIVEVANNSHGEITVKYVKIEQTNADTAPYHLDPLSREFNQVIPENDDFAFHLPTFGRPVRQQNPAVIGASTGVEVMVHVALTNGDLYRCEFAFPVR